jgi:hypothetical protein
MYERMLQEAHKATRDAYVAAADARIAAVEARMAARTVVPARSHSQQPPLPTDQHPSPFSSEAIVDAVIARFLERSRVGKHTLESCDPSILQWITRAQDELIDGILYLQKLKIML